MVAKSLFALGFGLEELLEVEKLEQGEQTAAKLGGTEVLFDQLKQQQNAEDAVEEGNDKDDASGDGADGAGDDISSDAGDAGDVTEPPEEESVAREEFRNVTFALESTKDDSQLWHYSNLPSGSTPAEAARSKFAQSAAILGTLGIGLTIKMAGALFRGVLAVFEKLGKLVFAGGKLLASYIERRQNSFKVLKDDIQGLNKIMDQLNEKGEPKDVSDASFTNEMTINALKIEGSVDFTANIQVLHEFVKSMINDLGQHTVNDLSGVKHLVYAGTHGVAKIPATIMNVPQIPGLRPGVVDGYDVQGEFTQSYRYEKTLPSNVVLIAGLPEEGISDLSAITKAYNDSTMVLGFDKSTFKEVKSVPVMPSENLRVFINELDKLCDLCIAHQAVYEKVQRVKSDLLSNFKNYFLSLTQKTQKVSLQESFVEQVYLKAMFVDKIYLSAAMDIHDYTAKTIQSGISYVKDCLKQLA